MADLPAELSTGMVTGRFIIALIDGDDAGQEPDVIPAKGTIRFKSSVPYVPVPVTTLGPVTVMKGPVVGVLDNEGYLCTPNPVTGEVMYRGVKLLATDDPDMAVTDWTWTAEYAFESVASSTMQIPAHGFSLPSDSTVDLTTVVKVPATTGYGLPQAEAASLRAEASATEAITAAESAVTIAQTAQSEAEQSRISAEQAANLVGAPADEVVKTLVEGETLTKAALSDTFAPVFARTMGMGAQPWHLSAYDKFFKGWSFQNGQGTAVTSLTASASLGGNTLSVSSGTGFINGTVVVLGAGTPTQQINKVLSGGGTTTLTLVNPLEFAAASGAEVAPLWGDNGHMNTVGNNAGWKAWVRFIIEARRPDGTRVLNNPTGKYVFMGNSWMTSGNQANYDAGIKNVYPNATVIMKGVSGNTSTQILARFDADVPADADFVIIPEPGVNDLGQALTSQERIDNIIALTRKVWAIGAVPVFTGGVPFSDKMGQSLQLAREYDAAFASPETFPALGAAGAITLKNEKAPGGGTRYGYRALENDTQGSSVAFGESALRNNTGPQNTALGQYAELANTTGGFNTAIGQAALMYNTAGGSNTAVGRAALENNTTNNGTAVGDEALRAVTSGNANSGIGRRAGAKVTTGNSNVFVGANAGEAPNFVTGNATTTASNQTFIGAYAGQGSATQRDNVTAIGKAALVDGNNATAIGSGASALHNDSTAIGFGVSTTEPGQLAVGAKSALFKNALFTPGTPVGGGVFYVEAGALKYKGSSGTVTTLAPA